MRKYIQDISFVSGFSGPARVGMTGRGLQLNTDVIEAINPEYIPPILLHEQGHLALNTSDEFAADRYSIDEYRRKGGNAKTVIQALCDQLDENNPVHLKRMQAALQYAIQTNGAEQYNYLSIGSPIRKRQRQARKDQAAAARANLKNAQATATVTLANQGIVFTPPPSGAEKIIGSVANLASNIFGKGGEQPYEPTPPVQQQYQYQPQQMPPVMQQISPERTTQYQEQPQVSRMSNMSADADTKKGGMAKQLPLIIAVGALVLVVVVLLIFKKR
jgi:hypothetical protein